MQTVGVSSDRSASSTLEGTGLDDEVWEVSGIVGCERWLSGRAWALRTRSRPTWTRIGGHDDTRRRSRTVALAVSMLQRRMSSRGSDFLETGSRGTSDHAADSSGVEHLESECHGSRGAFCLPRSRLRLCTTHVGSIDQQERCGSRSSQSGGRRPWRRQRTGRGRLDHPRAQSVGGDSRRVSSTWRAGPSPSHPRVWGTASRTAHWCGTPSSALPSTATRRPRSL